MSKNVESVLEDKIKILLEKTKSNDVDWIEYHGKIPNSSSIIDIVYAELPGCVVVVSNKDYGYEFSLELIATHLSNPYNLCKFNPETYIFGKAQFGRKGILYRTLFNAAKNSIADVNNQHSIRRIDEMFADISTLEAYDAIETALRLSLRTVGLTASEVRAIDWTDPAVKESLQNFAVLHILKKNNDNNNDQNN